MFIKARYFNNTENGRKFEARGIKATRNYIKEARISDPNGTVCSFCGKKNDFADDCGWFYICTGNGGACCESCFRGEPGKKHIAIYGLGER
jgi:hypothetical protein